MIFTSKRGGNFSRNLVNFKIADMVSVIIPCYNVETVVKRAIDSVLQQSFQEWELILVDNNSSDNTSSVLEGYQKEYPSKIKIFVEKKKGAPAARNRGLKEAMGKWIQFLDADDEISSGKIEGQFSIAEKNEPALVIGSYKIIKTFDGTEQFIDKKISSDDIWLGLIRSNLGITSANLWNRDVLLSVQGWDEGLPASQEYDLMFRMLQTLPMAEFDSRCVANVYISGLESVSRGGGKEKLQQILDARIVLRERIKDFLLKKQLLNPERLQYADEFIYTQLVYHYRFLPEYVKKKLKSSKLKVSLSTKINGLWLLLKIDIKRAAKGIFSRN